MEGLQDYRPHIGHIRPNLTEGDLDWRSGRHWLPSPRYSDAPHPHIKDAKFPQSIRLLRPFPQANMVSKEEWVFYPGLSQRRVQTVRAEEPRSGQDSPLQTTEVFMGRKKHITGARPYRSPEYSPGFHKLGSTLPRSTFGVPYLEKKRLRDKQEEIQEVKQLEEWKPAAAIFTTVLEGLDTKAS
uniref:spermatogenesis-associated serine-rich protein 1 n=1 Tax=Centroberyx gerrardi TaxID=166262 RepID=UPI003AACFC10